MSLAIIFDVTVRIPRHSAFIVNSVWLTVMTFILVQLQINAVFRLKSAARAEEDVRATSRTSSEEPRPDAHWRIRSRSSISMILLTQPELLVTCTLGHLNVKMTSVFHLSKTPCFEFSNLFQIDLMFVLSNSSFEL